MSHRTSTGGNVASNGRCFCPPAALFHGGVKMGFTPLRGMAQNSFYVASTPAGVAYSAAFFARTLTTLVFTEGFITKLRSTYALPPQE